MNLEFFIAKHLHFNKNKRNKSFRSSSQIAVIGIALGLSVMLTSIAIVIGFKHEIKDKVIAFGSHIQITNFDSNTTFETKPISISDSLLSDIQKIDGIKKVQPFGTKPGIIKTDNDVQGIILKGIDYNFDWEFYKKNIVEGDCLSLSKDSTTPNKNVVISLYISKLLKLKVGDDFLTYFIQDDNIRARKFHIQGIYCTNFEEYDKKFILTDLKQIQQLNNWQPNQVSGIEVLIKNYNRLNEIADKIYYRTSNKLQPDGSALLPKTIEEINPQIFSWLSILDMNVWIILILMIIVAGFNIISGLLILILEHTNTIGILKALGANNNSIQKIFLYQTYFLMSKGMLYGNCIGLLIIITQHYFHVIPLDPATYYIPYVPIELNTMYFILVNIGTFIISALMLTLPSRVISKINPSQSINFD